MKPNSEYENLHPRFWANVRSISQEIGYTDRKTSMVKVPTINDLRDAMTKIDLGFRHLVTARGKPTKLGQSILNYFDYRAKSLIKHAEPNLMNKDSAEQLYSDLLAKRRSKNPLPMNKQKGKKKKPAYFSSIINMLIESRLNDRPCDYNPRKLTTVTKNGVPIRTLARWVDGAFPSPTNPIAVWEIKEYYHTTTFGSRVADGVYETMLDGMELEELRWREKIDVKHYLMVDDHYTWWACGKSYLCRIIDMLHMGYVDEVLFGKEVVTRLPALVDEWVASEKHRDETTEPEKPTHQ